MCSLISLNAFITIINMRAIDVNRQNKTVAITRQTDNHNQKRVYARSLSCVIITQHNVLLVHCNTFGMHLCLFRAHCAYEFTIDYVYRELEQ